ncbi:SMP-30/gluconolactonase/LRE family protein [Actomonas aquatica]|uniref:SMP-30/gluconolactonase/LRE family protein n=1 Tax=Actomonas aquatica TaxID=2866162 RepID=A0ABZ1C910_9BACT|nr:SMP-30/gluconolactonase/LRE family protein [Opitutus sp. WL0086]WRQ88184.1 SMP-30/gluconolactonase/LRE family protein [Opitutus sp. WL0086]
MRFLSPALLACVFTSAHLTTATEPELLWETSGLAGPESVLYDHQREVFYASNMGTWGEGQTPHDGFISRLSSTGEVLDLHWITDLENPKGLALANGRLYVGDDLGLIEIDPDAGAIVARHTPSNGAEAGFNDCTADPDGNVFVFSYAAATIFRLQAGRLDPWVEIDMSETGGLNGLRAEAERLLVGGWSWRDAEGVEQLGHLTAIAYADRQLQRIGTTPIAHIDGVEPDGRGGYTVTDWLTGEVKHVTSDGHPSLLMTLPPGTADHDYLIDQQLLVLPLMKDDVVRAYRWAP